MPQTSQVLTRKGSLTLGIDEVARIDPELRDPNGSIVAPHEVNVFNGGVVVSIDENPVSPTYGTFRIQNKTTVQADIGWVAKFDHSIQFNYLQQTDQLTVGPGGLLPDPPGISWSSSGAESLSGVWIVNAAGATKYPDLPTAMTAAVASDLILLGPGTYDVSAVSPFSVKANVCIRANGCLGGSTIVGSLVMENGSRIENCTLFGIAGAPVARIDAAAIQVSISESLIVGADIGQDGILSDVNGATFIATSVLLVGGAVKSFISAQDGGNASVLQCSVVGGTCVNALEADTSIPGTPGVLRQDGQFTVFPAATVTNAVLLGESDAILVNVEMSPATNGVHITDASHDIQARGLVGGCVTNDILVDAGITAGEFSLTSSFLDEAKINIPSGYAADPLVTLDFIDSYTTLNQASKLWGDQHIGKPEEPNELYVGRGGPQVRLMSVLTNDNGEAGNWADITAALSSATGSTATLLPGLGVGNAFFVGSTEIWEAMRTIVTTAYVPGAGLLEISYWDGATWNTGVSPSSPAPANPSLPSMATQFEGQLSYANTPFERVDTEFIRFGEKSGWATKVLPGAPDTTARFWLKFEVVSAAITTAPVAELFELIQNSTRLCNVPIEYFGDDEPFRQLLANPRLSNEVAGALAGNQAINFSPLMNFNYNNNRFAGNADTIIGQVLSVPPWLDTSRSITFDLIWSPSVASAGDVEFRFYLDIVDAGDTVAGGGSDTLRRSVVTSVVAGDVDVIQRSTFTFSLPDALFGQFIRFALRRDATAGNPTDTYADPVDIIAYQLDGIAFRA